ncbi:ABC transporter ATP-binding protein [Saccharomonospora piscinae]|uniref:ABC transporter ATP-binding protein n=1 Tax=Saccharomonospora piscinae TaxID=687388 RepID=UPI001105D085|nr:ABC transporter ATP-binding protein [Saccharomonospora piscinae]TLW92333.1 ABC transporter ATP-binding protein [Saccharomonospora piscinae]
MNPDRSLVGAITRQHLPKVGGAVVLGLLAAVAGLAQPAMIGELIAAVGTNVPLLVPILIVVGLFVADAALTTAQAYLMGRTGERIVYDTRTALIERVLHADVRAFSRWRHGDIQARIVTDTSLLKIALAQSTASIIVDSFMVLGSVVLMFVIDPLLLGVTVACMAVASLVALVLARKLRKAAVRNRTIVGDLGADLHRAIGALNTVKACRAERLEGNRIGGLAVSARRSGVRVSALSAMLSPTMGIGLQASLAAVIITGMGRVATGSLGPAELTSFIMYLFYLVSPLVMLFMSIGQLQQGRAAIGRINELADIDQEPSVVLPPTPASTSERESTEFTESTEFIESTEDSVEPEAVVGNGAGVAFDRVRFAYGPDEPTLRGVSFTVPARGLTAIVGPSGSGKTTLLQLLMRLYPVSDGRILLDGENIASIPVHRLRGRVGYVQQESATLRGTIGDNLVYGEQHANADEIDRALRLAGLDEVVRSLPRGIHTEIGENGAGLSGGQRQRLAIARMLIRRPAVLLLDEATSNLDSDSELALRTTLRSIASECTVISVAHRMSTVVDADRIVVMEAGAVGAVGTHHELLRTSELYQRLNAIQFQGEQAAHGLPV